MALFHHHTHILTVCGLTAGHEFYFTSEKAFLQEIGRSLPAIIYCSAKAFIPSTGQIVARSSQQLLDLPQTLRYCGMTKTWQGLAVPANPDAAGVPPPVAAL